MNSCVLDTSFISSFLNTSDCLHEEAVHLFERYASYDMYIPATVSLELNMGIKSGKLLISNLDKFFSKADIHLVPIDAAFLKTFKKFCVKNKDINLKTIDFSILHTCELVEGGLLSFDALLKKAYDSLST